ncbi:MAG: hypothetical protein L0212_08000, partial [Acidobacteria bacterium]|nr:hypothetical protein [Acidobacteriota bacterium]
MKRKPADADAPPAKSGSVPDNFIPFEQIQALIDLLEERGLEEFELEREGVRIRIKRRGAAVPLPVFASPAVHSSAPEVSAAEREAAEAEDVHVVKSPIVGTFYSAPRPDAPPLVKLGDTV